jgi:hypothetical protein
MEVRLERSGESAPHRSLTAPLLAACLLALLTLTTTIPASASNTGINSATVNLAPPLVRSVMVTATAAFGNCTGPGGSGSSVDPSELEFPNGICTVGSVGPTSATGVTITNGTAPSHIDVNGQSATPSDSGQSWSLVVTGTPGTDQFREATNGSQFATVPSNEVIVPSIPVCDTGFTVTGGSGDCAAASGQTSTESLVLEGPSSSTDQNGPFTVTTTWTAVP